MWLWCHAGIHVSVLFAQTLSRTRVHGQWLPNVQNAHTHGATSLRVTCVSLLYRVDWTVLVFVFE